MDQSCMGWRFPHEILLGGVAVIVVIVGYLIARWLDHGLLLVCLPIAFAPGTLYPGCFPHCAPSPNFSLAGRFVPLLEREQAPCHFYHNIVSSSLQAASDEAS